MNSGIPRVTIGIPVYNGERYIGGAVEAFIAQTFGDIEIIVADNCSTDGTPEIVAALAARDARVRYVRHPENVGAPGNYNSLVALARAPYFRWAASDDLAGPTAIERCVEVLDEHPDVVLAYPKTTLMDADGTRIDDHEDRLHTTATRPSVRFWHVVTNLSLCNAMYGVVRASALRRTQLLGVFVGSDECFHAELALYGKFWEVPDRLFFRRMHEGASFSMNDEARRAFYDPAGRRSHGAREWRHVGHYFRAIMEAPVAPAERLRLLRMVGRIAVLQRRELLAEILPGLKPVPS